jgi:hypothetical protein
MNNALGLWQKILLERGAIYPPYALDYTMREGDLSYLPGGFADSAEFVQAQWGEEKLCLQVGCVPVVAWVQDVTETSSICFAVFFFSKPEKRKQEERD